MRRIGASCLVLTVAGVVAATGSAAAGARAPRSATAHPAGSECPNTGVSAPRAPLNPLALRRAPGGNPLRGASFFVDGPSHGAAAGQMARLLGIDANVPVGNYLPSFRDSVSFQSFLRNTVNRRIRTVAPGVQRNIRLLQKIAVQPEAQRISTASTNHGFQRGSPAGIASFTNKLFCDNFTADPGTVPIISTYFMHSVLGGCATNQQINSYMPLFRRRINAMVGATGNHRVVYLLELDAIGSSSCMARRGSLGSWERMLRFEVDRMATLPHAVVYVEGGYSDSNTPAYAARMLNRVDVRRIRGFFTNDTHLQWTIHEVHYCQAISRMTGGSHCVINTAQNGNGPLLNPHPGTQGIEDNCNPPGRALGPRPTTNTGFAHVDAFLWTHVPGNSAGHCRGGPANGFFFPALAIGMAARANGRLGPGFPSRPY